MNINKLAIYGARVRVNELMEEIKELKTFLKSGKPKLEKKARKKMSAAARKAISIRMKAHFAAKRKGKHDS